MPIVLSEAQIAQFHEQGYLVVEGLLDAGKDLRPLQAEYEVLLERLCEQWHAAGQLSSTYSGLPFGERLIRVFRESGKAYYEHFDISLPQTGVHADTPVHTGPAIFNLLTSPRLLDAVEDLIGPEIYSNPVQHVRIKIPDRWVSAEHQNALVTATEWHQDQGVILPEADESDILTVWTPITPATTENGCLQVIPGSHRAGLTLHCPATEVKAELHIPDVFLRLEEARPLPMQPGSALFMHRRTQHGSLSNKSDGIRWSFDLRYNPTGQPTGRPAFPGFVARSRANPSSALTDYRAWEELWLETRQRLAQSAKPTFNRWADGPAVCA